MFKGKILALCAALFCLQAGAVEEIKAAKTAREIQPLLVGASLPDVSLLSVEGKDVKLASLVNQPTVLIFYRGGW